MDKPADITPARKLRGCAAISLERRREIASMGGAAVPADRRSFSRDRDLARAAGARGGAAPSRRKDPGQ
jgi:general stress protein YciG